ncbi:hypothetical protein CC2G_007712 [Coprinopsis cinerea AmutBmut pab1-1]|nr:hypothetical protein CC2G_007712 [Coprinopsis cinerea AmutBmut pab1-1]
MNRRGSNGRLIGVKSPFSPSTMSPFSLIRKSLPLQRDDLSILSTLNSLVYAEMGRPVSALCSSRTRVQPSTSIPDKVQNVSSRSQVIASFPVIRLTTAALRGYETQALDSIATTLHHRSRVSQPKTELNMQPGSSSNDGLTAEELGRLLEWVVQKSPSPAFKGLSKDLPPWFLVVEEAAQSAKIPLQKRADIAIYLLKSQELKDFMQGRKALYREISGRKHWNWDDFKQDIKGIMESIERAGTMGSLSLFSISHKLLRLAAAHAHAQGGQGSGSTFLRAAGTVLAIGGATVLFPAVGILGLNALGFGAGGVVGGAF